MKPLLYILLAVSLVFSAGAAKMNIAVTELEGRGLDVGEAVTLTDALSSYLINTGAFRVMERGKMDVILKEQGFQASGACTDEACLVEMGQLLGVDHLVTGSIGKVGGTYSVNVRMIHIGTSEIVRTINKFYKGQIDGLLTEVIPGIARELAGVKKAAAAPVVTQQSAPAPKPAAPVVKKPSGEKSSNTLLWIGVGALVVGGGVVAFLVLTKDDDKDEDEDKEKTGSFELSWPTN